MKLGIIIQARTGSKRLPNKMIIPFYNNKNILELLLARVKTTTSIPICIATTHKSIDDSIENIARDNNVLIFRGNENNVLKRFINAAEENGFEKIIRICADNPFLDMDYLNKLIYNLKTLDYDYYAFYNNKGMPSILTHYGFWAEGVTLEALKKIENKTKEKIYLEHVTNYIYSNISEFTIFKDKIVDNIENKKHIRLTLDTWSDFKLLQTIYKQMINNNIGFSAEKAIKFIDNNNQWKSEMENNIKLNCK